MKKKSVMALLFAVLLITTTACNGTKGSSTDSGSAKAEASTEKITLKFATSQPDSHAMVQEIFNPFMEKVTELTDGQVEFEFYPGEQLGKVSDLLELTAGGVTDLAYYYPTYHPSQMPITSTLVQLPGMYTKSYDGTMALHKINKKSPVLDTDFLSNGVRPIWSYASPPAELWTKGKELKTPKDLDGKKIKVAGGVVTKATGSIGALPINISLAEMYEGFERGVFDVINTNAASINDYALFELAKYGTSGVELGGGAGVLVINEKVFQNLPGNVQEIIVQVGDELSGSNAKFYDDYNAKLIGEFRVSGINMYELTEEEKAQWQNFYGEFEESLIAEQKNPDLKATINAFREEAKKYQ